jgi:YVTN family beta-propeller protein
MIEPSDNVMHTSRKRRANGEETLANRMTTPYDSPTKSLSDLDFRILGQLEAIRGKRALPLGSPKQRALLGVLLLHANEPIARDRLIADLWGDAAPKTVNAVLNVYLSKLRRLLAYGVAEQLLVREPAGYVLRVPPERLDARRFEALMEQGRRELGNGDAQDAAVTLREALALWRGPALADFAFEPFAQSEIARLEELRLIALENRIEADLAVGHDDALVAELEALVSAHPYREGLRAQLMHALYRCGRQAEALETYRRARRIFVEELGIELGPRLQELERAILRHDTSLETPEAERAPEEERTEAPGQQRRRWTRWAVVPSAALVFVIGAAVVVAGRSPSNSSPTPVKLGGNSVAVVDPKHVAVVDEIPVGGRPTGIAVGEGSVWVANRDDDTLLRIDPGSRKVVRTIGLGRKPTSVAAGSGSIWVLSDWSVQRVDPDINDVVATIRLPRRGGLGFPWILIEVSKNAVWVCSCATLDGALAHIAPDTNSVVFLREGPVGVIAYGEGALWALTGYELDTIQRIDPRTNAVVETIPRGRIGETASGGPRRIAAGEGAVWSASETALWRLDPASGRFTGSVSLGHTPQSVAIGHGAIWVAAYDGTLLRIDPASRKVAKTISLGVHPAVDWDAIAVGEGAVWIAVTP